MKKMTAVCLRLAVALGLAACAQRTTEQPPVPSDTETTEALETIPATEETSPESTETTETTETTPAAQETGGTLVVYFSATGNTAEAATYIAQLTGGDLLALEPADPYTSEDLDWTNDNSRVSQEYYNEDLRNVELVADTVDNWDSYDTVFIGYPIWWGIAAWPVNTFVEANDFTGKTVIPFCTSSSSGLGESGELLAELAGTGDWQTGQRFRSSVDQADVQEWLDSLDLS